jgi:hypothetical protein
MHTKPLIDNVINEGRPIYRLSNMRFSYYQFIDNSRGLFEDFLSVELANERVQ